MERGNFKQNIFNFSSEKILFENQKKLITKLEKDLSA